jgi:hypothetical protein
MGTSGFLLAWSVNLLTGIGLILLGWMMLRRPERIWVGLRVARDPEEMARVRRANTWTAPWLLLLGAVDLLSGPVGYLARLDPLVLAIGGLGVLVVSIVVVIMTAVLSRPGSEGT